ncbi:hypothetical protein [Tardiphaga sp.]|uniref:hypothetical protein n=1 Tax=Tardiphaga sp. TaxID=1926292 RepID=UPI0026263EE2|nr:hypothetical protein [Tardiphaga sp.]MDB5620535.1 hypothetical protein [Tardiphaga sp.]
MNQELATAETARLKQCEKAIEKGLGTFVEVGQALLDIRDGKLYRASHKTFEAYCKERWDISRPRAYQLIEGAKTVQTIADVAGADLSTTVDKITERQSRELASDPIGAAQQIKARVEKGEEPAKATAEVIAERRADRQLRGKKPDPEVEALHAEARDSLPEAVKDQIATRDAAVAARKAAPTADEDLQDEIDELKNALGSKDSRIAELEAKLADLEPMRLEYKRGGFAEVIKGLAEQIRVLKTRVETESQEKVKNLRAMDFWKKEAIKLGYSRDEVIDLGAING